MMITRRQWRRFIDLPVVQWTIFAIGAVLLLISPLVGAVPGPGGLIFAGVGLALMLKTSMWARRRYVKFKRWQPKAGRWTDWALRRRSALRREKLRKERDGTGADLPLVDEARDSAVGELIPDAPLTPEEAQPKGGIASRAD